MKNKTALISSAVVLLLVLTGGGLLVKKLTTRPQTRPVAEEEETTLPEADASIAVDLKARADKRAVILDVANIPSGTLSVEYELSYLTGTGLPKGALGKVDLQGKTELSREILLGTCSKSVCTYDEGVTSVNLVLRFNHPDGASQFSKEYPLK